MNLFYKILLTLSLPIILSSCFEDGGNAPTGSCNPCKVFVTAATFQGNFGTVTAADQICATDIRHPGDGTYKALITYENGSRRACTSANCETAGASEGVDWVLQPNTTYTRLDGTVIGKTTSAAILPLPLTNPFSATAGRAWTGFSVPAWTSPVNQGCNNWTSTASMAPPGGGSSTINDGSNFNMAFAFGVNCSGSISLICVEQ